MGFHQALFMIGQATSSVILETTASGVIISNNGRTFFWQGSSSSTFKQAWIRSSTARTGKRYWEFTVNGNTNTNGYIMGLMAQSRWTGSGSSSEYPGNPFGEPMYGVTNINYFGTSPGLITNGSNVANNSYNFTINDVIGIAADFDAGKVWYRKNGTWIAGDPAAGTGQTHTIPSGAFDPYISVYGRNLNGYQLTGNFSSANFSSTPPTGFVALS